jgi:hypothetical protein
MAYFAVAVTKKGFFITLAPVQAPLMKSRLNSARPFRAASTSKGFNELFTVVIYESS